MHINEALVKSLFMAYVPRFYVLSLYDRYGILLGFLCKQHMVGGGGG